MAERGGCHRNGWGGQTMGNVLPQVSPSLCPTACVCACVHACLKKASEQEGCGCLATGALSFFSLAPRLCCIYAHFNTPLILSSGSDLEKKSTCLKVLQIFKTFPDQDGISLVTLVKGVVGDTSLNCKDCFCSSVPDVTHRAQKTILNTALSAS